MDNTSSSAELDISMAHPWSSDVIESSASNLETVMLPNKGAGKICKYSGKRLPIGHAPSVIPIVFEQFST